MIKILRDFVPKPQFMVMCDCACGMYNATPFEAGAFEDEQMAAWAAELKKQGWHINLASQTCPKHVKQEVGEGSRIIVPDFAGASRKN